MQSARTENNTSAVILSAGRSTRMGSHKGLLRFGEKSAIELLSTSMRAAGLDEIYIIVSSDVVAEEGERNHLRVLRNPRPESGRTGSIQIVNREAPSENALLIAPVDSPLISTTTIREILVASRTISHQVVRPLFSGRGGHPIWISPDVRPEIARLMEDEPLRSIVHSDTTRCFNLIVTDPEVLTDLNYPQDYESALARFRSRN